MGNRCCGSRPAPPACNGSRSGAFWLSRSGSCCRIQNIGADRVFFLPADIDDDSGKLTGPENSRGAMAGPDAPEPQRGVAGTDPAPAMAGCCLVSRGGEPFPSRSARVLHVLSDPPAPYAQRPPLFPWDFAP